MMNKSAINFHVQVFEAIHLNGFKASGSSYIFKVALEN